MRALADRVRVSRSNVYARVERLVAEGVITGFTVRTDPVRAGLGTTAYVLLTVDQNSWREVSEHLRDVPYVQHLAFVGGDVDMVMLVRTPDNVTLRDVVLAQVHARPGHPVDPDLADLRRGVRAPVVEYFALFDLAKSLRWIHQGTWPVR